ncbi:MAG: M4 family metallopeptidase [Anaerolineae bacterium]|jgi:bacillolysin
MRTRLLELVVAISSRAPQVIATRRRLLVLLLLFTSAAAGLALTDAHSQASPESLAAQLQARDQGEIAYHPRTGLVRFYSAGAEASARALQAAPSGEGAPADPQTTALTFLEAFGPIFGVNSPARELATFRVTEADRGRSFTRYQQLYQGVPVMGGELIVQVAGGTVLSANGEIAPIQSLSPEPTLSPLEAKELALALVRKGTGLAADQLQVTEPELWVYDPRLLTPHDLPPSLVWRMEISSQEAMLHQMVLIDAHRGAVVLQLDLVERALSRAIYDSGNTPRDALPGLHLRRSENEGPSGITDVDLAYDYFGDAYNFYANIHGRDSYDDAGAQLVATVRYCDTSEDCPYENAFWHPDYQQFAFGANMLADDVVAHEYTHAVTEHTSGLFYMYQSGAINESLSDIWGEFVDLSNGKGNDSPSVRWLTGEDLAIGAARDMADPPSFDQPDRVTSDLYWCFPPFSDYFDEGGVHMNSGILNKAAYLITDGGSFNGQSVTGLGIEKAAHIFYELQTNRLTSGSDFLDVSSLLPAACDSLVGSHGITTADCQQVRKAVVATELTMTPPSCGPSEAPVCPAGYAPKDLFFDNLENPASGNWVTQVITGSYVGWYYPQNSHGVSGLDKTNATSGVTNFWGIDIPEPADSAIAMSRGVALPAGKQAYLRFNHSFLFHHYTSKSANYDGGVIEYSVDGTTWQDASSLFEDNGYNGTIASGNGNPLGGRSGFVRTSHGYTSSRLDLSSLAGQSVRFRFRVGTDNEIGYPQFDGWFVDDIRIYTCNAAPPTPTPSPTVKPTATPTVVPTATPTPGPNYLPFVPRW